jgi:hypothetical protein
VSAVVVRAERERERERERSPRAEEEKFSFDLFFNNTNNAFFFRFILKALTHKRQKSRG